jgi:hypothetical protein
MRKEAQEANKDYWDQQISQAKARNTQEKVIFDNGGVAAAFLDKIFDQNDYLDSKEDLPDDPNRITSKSRMKVDHKKVE